jgi:hypothetical protein
MSQSSKVIQVFKKIFLFIASLSTVSAIAQATPALASLPAQSQVQSIQCPPGFNQVNQAVPSWQTPISTDPSTFILFSSCKPVGNGGIANPIFYLYDSIDAAFNPPSGLKDALNWKPNSAPATSKVCKAKANIGRDFVIAHNYVNTNPAPGTTGPGAGSYRSAIYLCKELARMPLPKFTPSIVGVKIQAQLLRSSLWLAGQHSADAINWRQEGFGYSSTLNIIPNKLEVYNLNGIALP